MKKLFFASILCFLAISFTASAQTYEVPKDYVLKVKEDYPKYNDDVVKTVDWLQQTSWAEQTDKRKEASAFFNSLDNRKSRRLYYDRITFT